MNEVTNIFKILSDETRLRIIALLYKEELCVCQLGGILEVSQPRISKCLSRLRDLNLVLDTRKEKFVYYSLKDENKLFLKIVEGLVENLEEYPQLKRDQDKIIDKERYLTQCCSTCGD